MLEMELNKVEQREEMAVCYFQFRNESDTAIPKFKVELFSFDQEKVINAHFLADFQDIPANKSIVKLVPARDTKTDEISSILLNRLIHDEDEPCCDLGDLRLTSRVEGISLHI